MKHLPLIFISLWAFSQFTGAVVALECTCEYNMGELSSSLPETELDTRCFRLAVPTEEWDAAHRVECTPGSDTCQCWGLMGVRGVGSDLSDAQSNARDTCRAVALEAAASIQVVECKNVSS